MTARLDVTPKTTEQNRIVRTGKSEAEVTNNKTRSSVVAKRPRDASCLSVGPVSFNSTKRRAQSSIISYTLALDLPLRKLNYVLFSSHQRIHWCVAFCAVDRPAP